MLYILPNALPGQDNNLKKLFKENQNLATSTTNHQYNTVSEKMVPKHNILSFQANIIIFHMIPVFCVFPEKEKKIMCIVQVKRCLENKNIKGRLR